jgi:DNA-binding MarR family transcriptional regulator
VNTPPTVIAAGKELLVFELGTLLSLTGKPVFRVCEQEFGISRREWVVLLVLWRKAPANPTQVAERTQLDRATTSQAISSLVSKGLVSKCQATGDRRQSLLHLTDDGRVLMGELQPRLASLDAALFSVLDADETRTFNSMLRRLSRRAKELQDPASSG